MADQPKVVTNPSTNRARRNFTLFDLINAVNTIIIINNNNHDDIYSAVIYGASHMREFTVVHLGQSRSAPGGRQLVDQAVNLTFESAYRLL